MPALLTVMQEVDPETKGCCDIAVYENALELLLKVRVAAAAVGYMELSHGIESLSTMQISTFCIGTDGENVTQSPRS